LIKHGRVRRGYIGVSAQTTAVPRRHASAAEIDNASGAMITAIEPNGPAALAGLMTLDSIVRVDGTPVTGIDDLIRLLNGERIGRSGYKACRPDRRRLLTATSLFRKSYADVLVIPARLAQ
jgi:S1-C subfamily serine protease